MSDNVMSICLTFKETKHKTPVHSIGVFLVYSICVFTKQG